MSDSLTEGMYAEQARRLWIAENPELHRRQVEAAKQEERDIIALRESTRKDLQAMFHELADQCTELNFLDRYMYDADAIRRKLAHITFLTTLLD